MKQDLKQLQKIEAIERLKILQDKFGLIGIVTKEFEKEDTLYYSEYLNKQFPAMLYWISNNQDYEKTIKQLEKEHNILVYHAILTRTTFGKLLTLLCVSANQDEWKRDRDELTEGLPCAYVMNLNDDNCSEFGCVQIAGAKGGITRLA